MNWVCGAVVAGAVGGLVAHVYRYGGLMLPRWVRRKRVLRLGVFRDVLVGAGTAPAAVYFTVTAAAGRPTLEAAVFFGLVAGFAGGPLLQQLAVDRLQARLGGQMQALHRAAMMGGEDDGGDSDGGNGRGGDTDAGKDTARSAR